MYEYKCNLVRVIDGDTAVVDIDLGFGVWLRNESVRLSGIDCPESRTSDPIEKIFGQAATARAVSLLSNGSLILHSQGFNGKFGRILGDFSIASDARRYTEIMLAEHHAVPWHDSATIRAQAHLKNRQLLESSGAVVINR
jgi:endonuclease YncB( thermonuclease family)